MPLVKRTIEPVEISRNRVIAGIKNELDFVTNSTLGNVIQQLSSLSKHVEDVFSELHHESCSLFNRTCQLNERIDRLKIKITQLNPTVEEVALMVCNRCDIVNGEQNRLLSTLVLLQDINMRKPFKSSVIKDQQIITITSRPYAVEEVYKRCEPPPALQKLNPYRHDGKDSLKFYTEPGYFFELWCQAMQKDAKYQMKRHKRVRRPQKMTAEPPKVPTNPCQENRKLLPDSDHMIDASYRYGCVQYLECQIHPGAVDLRKNKELIANDCQRGEHIRNDACNRVVQEVIANSDGHLEEYVADATPIAANGESMRPAAEANEKEKDKVDDLDAVTDLKLVRPSSLELPTPVTGPACLEKTNSQVPIVNDLNISEVPKKAESSLHLKYSACQSTAGTQVGAVAPQKLAGEQKDLARTSLTMCKATVEMPTSNKELSLLVEVVSSKHMSGAKVSSSSILGTLPSVPPPVASAASSTAEGQPPDGSQVADARGKNLSDQMSPKQNIEQNMIDHSPNESYFLGHSVSVENSRDPLDENAWGDDSLPAELNTKSSTPDSVDLPPPPSPPPFSHAPDSPSLISLPPLPPPPLEEADEVKFGFSGVQPLHSVQADKAIDSSSSLLPNGNVRHLSSSMQNSVSTEPPQIDSISTISDSSLVTISSGSTSRSEGATTVALELPLVRDTRCDLLAAIREGIKLRKVEERRQKTEQKHLPTRRLDVQTIMEAAFEMRRKVLEENDSEEEEDEFDSNWSDED